MQCHTKINRKCDKCKQQQKLALINQLYSSYFLVVQSISDSFLNFPEFIYFSQKQNVKYLKVIAIQLVADHLEIQRNHPNLVQDYHILQILLCDLDVIHYQFAFDYHSSVEINYYVKIKSEETKFKVGIILILIQTKENYQAKNENY
ncbi:hypothetical protein ABPG72_017584 [Tetrahymena utriculariae]